LSEIAVGDEAEEEPVIVY